LYSLCITRLTWFFTYMIIIIIIIIIIITLHCT